WALRDVSFDVQPGEVIGVIGRNGAGKSTLLKILSRITEPTSGEARIRGRVASLLEVGTGFHPELTGRENVFLNGAILGMSKQEIRSKFDEIVAFAEIEKFIDTPVKRYSSGMYVRLAFAVAAHLEPEILIVDEVLAVGDSTFQRKCIGKMREVSGRDGRTVLFVSHMMTTLQALCDKAIFLEGGKTEGIESVHTAVSKYLHGEGGIETPECVLPPPSPDTEAVLERVRIVDSSGKPSVRLKTSEPWTVEMEWKNVAGVPVNPNIQLRNISGVVALIAVDANNDWDGSKKRARGPYKTRVQIPAHFLNGNEYWLSASLDCASPQRAYHGATDAMRITLWDPMDEKSIARGHFTKPREDAITWPALEWKSTGPNGEIR
ncbi:MAG: polysaccharide ABC transporter ATP-binding protein, partial [Chthoniobacterales bacterium]